VGGDGREDGREAVLEDDTADNGNDVVVLRGRRYGIELFGLRTNKEDLGGAVSVEGVCDRCAQPYAK
jgi:hypothetical protein